MLYNVIYIILVHIHTHSTRRNQTGTRRNQTVFFQWWSYCMEKMQTRCCLTINRWIRIKKLCVLYFWVVLSLSLWRGSGEWRHSPSWLSPSSHVLSVFPSPSLASYVWQHSVSFETQRWGHDVRACDEMWVQDSRHVDHTGRFWRVQSEWARVDSSPWMCPIRCHISSSHVLSPSQTTSSFAFSICHPGHTHFFT